MFRQLPNLLRLRRKSHLPQTTPRYRLQPFYPPSLLGRPSIKPRKQPRWRSVNLLAVALVLDLVLVLDLALARTNKSVICAAGIVRVLPFLPFSLGNRTLAKTPRPHASCVRSLPMSSSARSSRSNPFPPIFIYISPTPRATPITSDAYCRFVRLTVC